MTYKTHFVHLDLHPSYLSISYNIDTILRLVQKDRTYVDIPELLSVG